ncbi:MAG: hypothetical protein HN405_09760 [Planctomycetes bacterium]|jgi:hypothetical protein|nr:hypothetical protein [Planctomycetota bacterium]MBT4028657.1 hypothetical protein [Planctomycetota bacterium]MBT4559550.1 hypothetical protein [Planctomycetota bacterium]MBT5100793.1 hypothetical protein [Planctomycetota bacterium]MBT7011450.1 hypothetical protein [Planctomycetota bacterium]
MSRFEAAEYIQVKKEFLERKPTTILRMTPTGPTALDAYREAMRESLDES